MPAGRKGFEWPWNALQALSGAVWKGVVQSLSRGFFFFRMEGSLRAFSSSEKTPLFSPERDREASMSFRRVSCRA